MVNRYYLLTIEIVFALGVNMSVSFLLLVTMITGLAFHIRRRRVLKLRSNLDGYGSPVIR